MIWILPDPLFVYNVKGLAQMAMVSLSFGRATAAAIAPPLPPIGFDKTSDAKDQGPGHDNSH